MNPHPVGSLVYYKYDDFRTYLCRVDGEPYHDFGNEKKPPRWPLLVLECWLTARQSWTRYTDDPSIGERRNIKGWHLRQVPAIDQLAWVARSQS